MKYIYLFEIISDALEFERKLKKLEIDMKLIPTPRKYSASCSICALVSEKNVEQIEKIFKNKKFEKFPYDN
ncbi:MAG: DUF3343 domain-containing protein [Tissierellia bacterium]|nr:DUF3343 domain-containing protein [Tissierellia bacterium]